MKSGVEHIVSTVERIVVFIGVFAAVWSSQAQGTVLFNNRDISGVDARVFDPEGRGLGEGYTAQLFAGPVGSPIESFSPLVPTTVFRTTSEAARGYVVPLLDPLVIPAIAPGESAWFVMRAYDGETWESSLCRGESNLFQIQVGGGDLPVTSLIGLQGFQVSCIPEPSTWALLALGGFGLRLFRNRLPVRSWRGVLWDYLCSDGTAVEPEGLIRYRNRVALRAPFSRHRSVEFPRGRLRRPLGMSGSRWPARRSFPT